MPIMNTSPVRKRKSPVKGWWREGEREGEREREMVKGKVIAWPPQLACPER